MISEFVDLQKVDGFFFMISHTVSHTVDILKTSVYD